MNSFLLKSQTGEFVM